MTVIEELLEAFKAQQQTIETLTVKLEETTAELEKPKQGLKNWKKCFIKTAITAASRHRLTVMKSRPPKASAKRVVKRLAGRPGTRGIIWNLETSIMLSRFIRGIAKIARIGETVPI